jgi:hypothetical protein
VVPLREHREQHFYTFLSSVAFCVLDAKFVSNCVLSGFADASLVGKVCRVGAVYLCVDLGATMLLDSLELRRLASRTLFARFLKHSFHWAERTMVDQVRIEV